MISTGEVDRAQTDADLQEIDEILGEGEAF